MARTTKASNAVLRLKQRSNEAPYSMVNMSDGRFYLILSNETESPEKVSEPLEIDAFVQFVNNLQKQTPKKLSKFDIAFEEKIKLSKNKY
jgi:hypothetical protein